VSVLSLICSVHTFKGKQSCLSARHEGMWGSGGIAPRVFNFDTRWIWVIRLAPWPLYPSGKSPEHPLSRRLCGLQNRSGHFEEEKFLPTLPGFEPYLFSLSSFNLVTKPTDVHTFSLCLFAIYWSLVLPYTPRSFKWSLSLIYSVFDVQVAVHRDKFL